MCPYASLVSGHGDDIHSEADIARTLYGNWHAEHLFALTQDMQWYDFYQKEITACDRQFEMQPQQFEDKSGGQVLRPRARRKRRGDNRERVVRHLSRPSKELGFGLVALEEPAVEPIAISQARLREVPWQRTEQRGKVGPTH